MVGLSRLWKTFVALAVVILILYGSFGLPHFGMSSSMGMNGEMGPCPFMPSVAICNMTPLQHIAAAQSILTATPQERSNLLFMLLLAFAALITASFYRRILWPPLVPVSLTFVKYPAFAQSSLQEAYSRGILNPKIF